MRLNSKHKLYGTVLGLCGLALLADKALFSPSEASADISPEDLVVVADDSEPLAPTPQINADPATVVMNATAAQLEEIAASRPVLAQTEFRDAFTPDPSWAPPKTVEDIVIDDGSPADVFRSNHALQAVMAGARGIRPRQWTRPADRTNARRLRAGPDRRRLRGLPGGWSAGRTRATARDREREVTRTSVLWVK